MERLRSPNALEDSFPFILCRTLGSDNSTMSCKSCVPGISILDNLRTALLEADLSLECCGVGAVTASPGRHNSNATAAGNRCFK